MRLHCDIVELHLAVRSLHDVWKDHHADGDGAVGLSVKEGEKKIIIRAASMRSYGQAEVGLSEPAQEDVELVLDASMLVALLKKIQEAQVYVEGKVMTLRQAQAEREYQLNSLTDEVAPRPHDLPEGGRLLDMDAVREVGDALTLCTSVSDMRTALGGVQMQWLDGNLHMVATDSYRLLHAQMPMLDPQLDEASQVIVPVRGFEWLLKTSKLLHIGAAHVCFSERWLVLRLGTTEYVTAPQAGRFPPWKDIMPEVADGEPQAVFEREDILAALQRLQPFTGPADHILARQISGALRINAKDSVLGHAHETIRPLSGHIGLDDIASYTAALLLGILNKLHTDDLAILWPRGARGPLVIHAAQGRIHYLQMPLHTGGGV